ncbi:MAG: pentapeptide repeat-containing protein [Deltaproteobacteria bacterium]|nr:pentapeptide repeat-containing protein [Deltaproteobacteria bacterium]
MRSVAGERRRFNQRSQRELLGERHRVVTHRRLRERFRSETTGLEEAAELRHDGLRHERLRRDRLPGLEEAAELRHPGLRNDGFRNDGFRNDGFRNDGFRNDGFRNHGFRNHGFRNHGFRCDGFRYGGGLRIRRGNGSLCAKRGVELGELGEQPA